MLAQSGRPADPLVKALVGDPRFDELNFMSFEVLAKWVNARLKREVVPEAELDAVSSPAGTVDFYYSQLAAAEAAQPKETRVFLEKLSRWRQAIRAAL